MSNAQATIAAVGPQSLGVQEPVSEQDADRAAVSQLNFFSRAQVLECCVRLAAKVPGHIIEFGVADGSSTRVIRRTLNRMRWNLFVPFRHKRIFACDSFEGLPEAFESAPVGAFAQAVPKIPGVIFVKGYFDKTLTPELQARIGQVAFAHLDADLYSSTKTALEWLTPLLNTGSLLLFDEFDGDHGAECRALDEWREKHGIKVARIAEFARDPSGFGREQLDRRVLFQVLGTRQLSLKHVRGSLPWRVSYYLNRLGWKELRSRFESWAN